MSGSQADAARRLTQLDVSPAELTEIAAAFPDLRPAVAAHPSCHPELRAWVAQVIPPATPVLATPAAALQAPLSAAPQVPTRRARLPWIVAAVAVVVALVSVGALVVARPGGPAAEKGERGFASPEDAVDYFAARVAVADLDGASDAFALESMVDGFSFRAVSEEAGVVTPTTWLPESSPGYRAVNEDRRRGDVALQVSLFVEGLMAPDGTFDRTQQLGAGLTAADLEAVLAPDLLESLSVIRVDELCGPSSGSSESFDALAQAYGADEAREVAVLYSTEYGSAVGGMQLLRFGDEWFIWNLNSFVMGIIMGDFVWMSEQQYLAALASRE